MLIDNMKNKQQIERSINCIVKKIDILQIERRQIVCFMMAVRWISKAKSQKIQQDKKISTRQI